MLASIGELLAFGAFWFWILVAAEIGILFLCSFAEKGFLAAISVLVFGAILQFYSGVDILGFVTTNPIHAVVAVLLYLICGVVWSIIRWNLYYGSKMQRLIDGRRDWYMNQFRYGNGKSRDEAGKEYDQTGSVPSEYVGKWNEYIDENAPTAASNKSRICTWMGLFPIDIVYYFCSDFLSDLFSRLYQRLAVVYDNIANRHKRRAKL